MMGASYYHDDDLKIIIINIYLQLFIINSKNVRI